jgi:hypothetical protein
MEPDELKNIWHAHEEKLEKSLILNRKMIEEIQTRKAVSKLNSFLISQWIGIVAGIVWVLFLGFLVYHLLGYLYFSISAGMIMLFTSLAIFVYIKHVVIIGRINIGGSITETQRKLASVQASLINVGRLMFLQTPFYCTFFISDKLVKHGGATFWTIEIVVTAFFTFLSIWLYRSLTSKNMYKKWVRKMIDGLGAKSVRKAMEFVNEIDEFRKER